MKEWQIGILAGVFVTISIILLDTFFALPYLIELLIATVFSVICTFIGNKLLNKRQKHKESTGGYS
ncbi:hypothetical protein [uncultured Marinococcus sp.]|uniref:hypothetical protein n=1 Tax=uncultured Marinococcus sp. TaxID=487012 RepID=UPI00261EDB77|nr:hypothetical protein [uncultured Marinococcus sp.]